VSLISKQDKIRENKNPSFAQMCIQKLSGARFVGFQPGKFL